MKIIILLLLMIKAEAATWKKLNSANSTPAAGNTNCPSGYVGVPALAPYTVRYFCVMKYEAKIGNDLNVISAAAGVPTSNDRPTARSQCQNAGVGYDLISNDQWQTIARNIAGVASNWSSGVVASGELNRGQTDGTPSGSIAASTDDNDACFGTGQTCSSTVWDSQRRTHTLSNGSVIWDFSGNAWKWVTNDNTLSNGADGSISLMSSGDIRQTRYGASTASLCANPSSSPNCGMGNGWFNYSTGAVVRGGDNGSGSLGGIFAVAMNYAPSSSAGFRCIYVP